MSKLNKMFDLNKVNRACLSLPKGNNKGNRLQIPSTTKKRSKGKFSTLGIDGKAKIDSICLWIPVKHLILKNQHLYVEEIHTVYTGEVDIKYVGFKEERDGIKTFFRKRILPIQDKKTKRWSTTRCLEINILAKHLGSRYFEGLNANNIHLAIGYINALNPDFQFPLDAVLNHGKVINIDICKDVECSFPWMNMGNYIEALWIEALGNGFKPTKPKTDYFYKNGSRCFTGIKFAGRKSKKKTLPPFKGYSKSLDLYDNSFEFCNKFLKGFNMDNVFRLEGTLNGHNLRDFFETKKLSDVLPNKKAISQAFDYMFNRYFGGCTKQTSKRKKAGGMETSRKEEKKELSSNNLALLNALAYMLKDMTLDQAIEKMTFGNPNERNKKAMKKKLHGLYIDHILRGQIEQDIHTFYKDFNLQ